MSAPSFAASFVGALRFFTRLRIPGTLGRDSLALGRAIGFLPATGLIVGGLAALAFTASVLVLPKTLAVALAIGVAIALTGALHEDGWNDTVDGFGSSTDQQEILAIMRDSQVRAVGAAALVALLVSRLLALVELDQALIPAALVAGHAVSRFCAAVVFARLDYVRAEGKAKPFSQPLRRHGLVLAALPALVPLYFLPFWSVVLALVFAGAATWWLARLFKRRIGGYTGDCLGAAQQFAELAFYGGLLCRLA
ncbi:MAG: adenosylcobinamide-GDP ribazoletransferase [Propionivibrio sp.]